MMCAVGMAWLPIVTNAQQLFVYIQSVSNYLSPPITAIFVIALFLKNARPYEPAAFFAMMVGFGLGLARLVCHIAYGTNEENKGTTFTTMNFMHFGLMVLAITSAAFGLAACWVRRFAMLHQKGRYEIGYAVAGGSADGSAAAGGAAAREFANPLVANGSSSSSSSSSGSGGGSGGGGGGGSGEQVLQGVPTRSGGGYRAGSDTTELLLDNGRRSSSPIARNPPSSAAEATLAHGAGADGDVAGRSGAGDSVASPATFPSYPDGSESKDRKAGVGAEVELVGWSTMWQHIKEEHRHYPWHTALSVVTVAVVLGMYIGFG